uniref:Uncharacterized protein n=1 Tax=Arundo donax TaxID=35708 RepID=A0A0A9E9G7_ARUDO
MTLLPSFSNWSIESCLTMPPKAPPVSAATTTALWCNRTPVGGVELFERAGSGFMRLEFCLPLGVASGDCSLSGECSISPLTCLAFTAAKVALIASASAADASTK